MKVLLSTVLLLASSALANPPPPAAYPSPYPAPAEEPPRYEYAYAVKDEYAGLDFDANENRDGDQTEGGYRVVLPDGRTQIVTYRVTDGYSGIIMDVTYEGEAQFPEEKPSYPPPAPPAYPPPPPPPPAPAYGYYY